MEEGAHATAQKDGHFSDNGQPHLPSGKVSLLPGLDLAWVHSLVGTDCCCHAHFESCSICIHPPHDKLTTTTTIAFLPGFFCCRSFCCE